MLRLDRNRYLVVDQNIKLGCLKWKMVFSSIRKMRIFRYKVLFGLLLSIDTFYSIQWFWQRTVIALIRLHECSLIWAFAVCTCPEGTVSLGVAQFSMCAWKFAEWLVWKWLYMNEDVCSCVPFAVSTLYMYRESVRDTFYTFAIRVGDYD